jgi:hypothetical protein
MFKTNKIEEIIFIYQILMGWLWLSLILASFVIIPIKVLIALLGGR